MGNNFYQAVACDVFISVSLCCPFSPRDVLDEIWDLIGLVSEGLPNYFYTFRVTKNRNNKVVVGLMLYIHCMSGRSVNLTILFLGRLRPQKWLPSAQCPYFRQ